MVAMAHEAARPRHKVNSRKALPLDPFYDVFMPPARVASVWAGAEGAASVRVGGAGWAEGEGRVAFASAGRAPPQPNDGG